MRIKQDKMISIIVPVYNVRAYLHACVDSIVVQSYKNLEIILVDDGSTDGSGEICDVYAKEDGRIRVLHQKNSGVSNARNNALSIAKGDYIGFVDSDDVIDKNMFEILVTNIELYGTDAIFCNYQLVNNNYEVIENNIISIEDGVYDSKTAQWAATVRPGFITAIWNKLFVRRVIYNELNEFTPFKVGLTVGEDQLWLMEVLEKCESIYTLNKPLYKWLRREGSASRNSGITTQRLDELFVAEYVQEKYSCYSDELSRAANVKLYLVAVALYFEKWKIKDLNDIERIVRDMNIGRNDWFKYSEFTLIQRVKIFLKEFCIRMIWK